MTAGMHKMPFVNLMVRMDGGLSCQPKLVVDVAETVMVLI
jgi:hypothetical protein